MGNYVPLDKTPKPKRTVSRALLEAERDHLLDCPNAEFPLRAAAFVLDAILCTILWKGLGASASAIGTYVHGTFFPNAAADGWDARQAVVFFAQVTKMAMLYLYCVWCEVRHGGSPAKLLLGLRVVDAKS